MSSNYPLILRADALPAHLSLDPRERDLLAQARKLFDAGFPDHALLGIWNAAVNNLRRRVENYGSELFSSAVKDEAGRKRYQKDQETLSERWEGVDDLVLLTGATRLGLLNKKAAKSLEMINWMRNHASPAHDSEAQVEAEDVVGLAIILQKNLFEQPLPVAGHSPAGLFEPIKSTVLDEERLTLLSEQIRSYSLPNVRVTFGFLLDLIEDRKEPALTNARALFPAAWEKAGEDLRRAAGARYHTVRVNPEAAVEGADLRLLETLITNNGIGYIPEGARASIYRRAAKDLARAKDTSYGWGDEVAAAKGLEQLGPFVPPQAFEDVYQEILAVWCGNLWGRSSAHVNLAAFVDTLDTRQVLRLCRMFDTSERAKEELFQPKPRQRAIDLLTQLRAKLSVQAHLNELDDIHKRVMRE